MKNELKMKHSTIRIMLAYLLLIFILAGCTKVNSKLDQSTSSESLSINSILLMEQIAKVVPAYTHEYNIVVNPYVFSNKPQAIYFVVRLTPPLCDDDKTFSYIMKYYTDISEWVVSNQINSRIEGLEMYQSSLLTFLIHRQTIYGCFVDAQNLQSDFVWHDFDHSFEPLTEGQDNLYRIGFTNNKNHYLTAISLSGEVLWKYPQISHMDICDRVYYPLKGSFEKEGIFHLFCCEDDELWHVILDVQTGEVLLKEFLQLDMYETWSIKPMDYAHDSTHIITIDNNIFLTGMYEQGTYVVKYELQEDGSLLEKWKQTYPDLYLHTEDLNLSTSSKNQQLVLTVWDTPYSVKNRRDGYYGNNGTNTQLFGLDVKNGEILWQYKIDPPDSYTNIRMINDTYFSSSICREVFYYSPGTPKTFLHKILYFDMQQGKPIWERTFENLNPVNYHGRIVNPFLFVMNPKQSYVFDIEAKTMLILNTLDGTTISTQPLPMDTSEEISQPSILHNDQFILFTI